MSLNLDDSTELPAIFYIGQHEIRRQHAVNDETVRFAQEDCNYDMLTAPITTDAFNSRVLSLLSPILDSGRDLKLHSSDQLGQLSGLSFPTVPTLNPADSNVTPSNTVSQLILTTSPWIDLTSPDPLIANVSRQVLQLEVQYAAFCGATNVMICGPRMNRSQCQPAGLSQYARAILEALRAGPYFQVHILLPMFGQEDGSTYQDIGDLSQYASVHPRWSMVTGDDSTEARFHSWDVWNTIRSMCKYNARLSVALTVPRDLPPISLQSRWYSEPLRILHMPGNTFLQTNQAKVSLSPMHRQLLEQYMRLRNAPWILLSGVGALQDHSTIHSSTQTVHSANDPTPSEAAQMLADGESNPITPGSHLRYLRDLQFTLPTRPAIEKFGAGYQDYLQNPLQPLSDNLESITYEVFEKDPVKYEWYEKAIISALSDWKGKSKPASGRNGLVVVAIVGAGRGPLITRALQASTKSGIKIDLWALEKNQNAFVLLQRHNQESWNGKVNLVQADMRSWSGPFYHSNTTNKQKVSYPIDILVSELLGSFADNELSPECLDGVQHLLNTTHGLSIPTSYAAYLSPIAAPKLHADILSRNASGDTEAFQTPYVVLLQAVDMLSTRLPPRNPSSARPKSHQTIPIPVIQEAWGFSHPSQAATSGGESSKDNQHNCRQTRLDFHCRDRGTCHGLAGYFETTLYESTTVDPAKHKDLAENQLPTRIELSTNPLTMDQKSKDMISWFPIFFPLKVPMYFPDNSLLSVSMWRQTDGRKVWYEWMVESFLLLDVGADGSQRVERLAISDLHSSAASGCLL